MDERPGQIAALRAGDPAAIERLYREHAAQVLGWVIRLGGPQLDAEDVAHEVFIVALRRLDSFRGDAKVSTWLFGVTRRVVANARRKAALRTLVGLSTIADLQDDRDGSDVELERLRQRRAVQHALERLRPQHREALVLCELEGRPAAEVAEMLGIPVGTVYSRVHHAKRLFAKSMRREGLVPIEEDAAPRGEVLSFRREP